MTGRGIILVMRPARGLAALLAPTFAAAQIGHDPARSPYRDLERRHEVSLVTGHFRTPSDPARVAPGSGPVFGMRYQWLAGGPANLTAEVARVGSFRRVLDPELPGTCTGVPAEDCKLIRTYRWPLYLADAGVALNLTGARSYARLVPEVRGGLGLFTDFHTRADIGDFAVGTRVFFSYGAGVRWVPGGPYQLRLDMANRLYSVKYPASYYVAAPDGSRIREPLSKRSAWLNTTALTLGLSYLFGG